MDLSRKKKEFNGRRTRSTVLAPVELPTKMDSENIKINVYLLEELIEEILSRLPVKSLVRLRCVSKSWLSLITSERFIEAHRQNSTKNRAFSHYRVIFKRNDGVFEQCSVKQLLNATSSIEPCRIQHPTSSIAVGCCNGLLCLFKYQRGLFLWNPATMIFMELPNLNGLRFAKYGFGWDGRSGAYKVFALSNHRGIRKGNVYSSKTNLWKTVEQGACLSLHAMNGVFACGKIHWIIQRSEDNYYIESFDLGSEEFGRIELPFQSPPVSHYRRQYKLAEIGGCLHLVCVDMPDKQTYVVIVWVMKETGWLKLFTHPLSSDLRYNPILPLCGGGPNGEIFLIIPDNILVYDGKDFIVHPESENIKYFRQGCVYVESLVSPKFTTTI